MRQASPLPVRSNAGLSLVVALGDAWAAVVSAAVVAGAVVAVLAAGLALLEQPATPAKAVSRMSRGVRRAFTIHHA
jgi:hypothetical protein